MSMSRELIENDFLNFKFKKMKSKIFHYVKMLTFIMAEIGLQLN